MRTWRKSMPSNCESRLWPRVSAVMPVPSEMKNTVRVRFTMTEGAGKGSRIARCRKAFNSGNWKGQKMTTGSTPRVIAFDHLRMNDVDKVGGKNASLGEMIGQLSASGVRVPGGFATTAEAYREFLGHGGLAARINAALAALDVDDVTALARTGAQIRRWVVDTPFPPALEAQIKTHYDALAAACGADASFAVRSSA